jgi:hypothetical protein
MNVSIPEEQRNRIQETAGNAEAGLKRTVLQGAV